MAGPKYGTGKVQGDLEISSFVKKKKVIKY